MTATKPALDRQADRVLRPSEQDLYDAWRTLVEANAEQVARLWEARPTNDLWGPGYGNILVDLDTPSPHAQAVTPLAQPEDTWLDIGAGFGSTGSPWPATSATLPQSILLLG